MIPKVDPTNEAATFAKHIDWRRRLLAEANGNEDMQAQLRAACSMSAWFWINAFCFTFRPKRVNPDGTTAICVGHEANVPFVTWAVQDEFIGDLCDSIDGARDVLIDKSRDMGASWLCLSVIHWYWQFKQSMTFMELSRKEEYVDRKGEMDTLFEKHRYLLKMQPKWLQPLRIKDNYMLLANLANSSTIIGESTNGDAGRGGRKHAILLDEFAAVQNGAEICAATADTTGCRIFNSTPGGPGTEFAKIIEENRARVLKLPWWRHPEKGRGAYQILDERGRAKWVSAWYLAECGRRSKKEVAQELDMDHGKAGDVFFDEDEIERHKRAHVRVPEVVGNVTLADDYGAEAKTRIVRRMDTDCLAFVTGGQRPSLRLWVPTINGRPAQDYTYVQGIDIGMGSGDANSVSSVGCVELGMKVAEFATATMSPEAFGEACVWLAIWFGGLRGGAYMAWENNGPGGIFGRKVVNELGYPHYYVTRVEGAKVEAKTDRYGWNSNEKKKLVLCGRYRDALATDRVIIPNEESLEEAKKYVVDEQGGLVPARLKDLTTGARQTHGDRVIADALMWLAMEEATKKRESLHRPPEGSPAWRRAQSIKRTERSGEWS